MKKLMILTLALVGFNMQAKMEEMYKKIGYKLGVYFINVSDSYKLEIKDFAVGSTTLAPKESKYVVLPVDKSTTIKAFDKEGNEVDEQTVMRGSNKEKVFEVQVGRFSGRKSPSLKPQISVSKLSREEATKEYPTLDF